MQGNINIRDHYFKTILTLDRFSPGNYNGIIVENAVDWLMKQNCLFHRFCF
ncbi:MAG: hypothetical protein Q4D76_07690 [Oscillospiraceae bacterium]|nr:hypothetical protein [Oscillospiraceae bacterium]